VIHHQRNKCNDCPDYDLCGNCFSKRSEVHHPEHTFTSIERPPRCPRRRFVAEHQLFPPQAEPAQAETAQEIAAVETVVEPQIAPEPEQAAEEGRQALSKENLVENLQSLEAMGFADRQKNVALLITCGGDMTAVVEHLLSE